MIKVNTAKHTKYLNYNVWLNTDSALKNQCKDIPEPQTNPGLLTISGSELVEVLHCDSLFLSIYLTANNHYLAVMLWQISHAHALH